MARDKALEALVNDELEGRPGITQKAMFGGLTWLWNGKLVCGARAGLMLVRLGEGNDAWALALDGVTPMVSGSRPMTGWVRASPEVYANDEMRQRLLRAALEFVQSLPPKP
ncbi:MAG: TfoX/Sxy family protein [Edaphobacter sp.]|uniref:TfoX/Sxy family protein n=1 Tax=Edaphobacter sp. TaxID=1934404 RepID=UPI0023A57B40|nr:TfoX/Sxy family protein [Edaphobacter sp.]MDE1177017.1 TfoX/Sxy family protein [Edaphobacter sp.]